ncbi:MAG: hypothetical protein ABW250_00350 [Pyrinomonadaceae bacterium]
MTQSDAFPESAPAPPPEPGVAPVQPEQTTVKPPEPQQPPPPAEAAPPAKSEMKNSIGSLFSDKASFANNHREVNYYFAEKHGLSSALVSYFTFNDIWRVSLDKQEEISGLFVADPVEVEHLRRILVEQRILILTGEPGLGKTTTAIHLANVVLERAGGEDAEAEPPETYLIPTLDRHVKIDLHEVCECDEEPGHRFVVFKDAFARRNQDLVGFFAQLTQFSLGEFADKLRKDDSYLIFTVTPSEATQLRTGLADGDLCYELKHLSDELLLEGLRRKLAHLARSPQVAPERLKRLQDPAQQKVVTTRLRTMPRLVRFVEYYVRDSVADLEADLDEAIRRFEDITYWFQRDLPADFEAWCFTMSLGLAHCLCETRGVSWVEFENLRRSLRQCLKRDPELFPPRSSLNEPQLGELSEKAQALIDDTFLEKSRAEILKDPNSLADLIRFGDDSYPHKLWDILLKHHRRVLTTLLPRLVEMAEDHSGKYDPGQRALCARIIGRIGEIDPDRVTLNIIDRWISSEDVRHRATIGALYQGILASRNERYRAYFLELLKSLTAPDKAGAGREEEKNMLLTSIAVYAQIGDYDLSLAMKGLESIARAKLVPVMRDVQRIGRLLDRTENEFAQQLSAEEAIGILIYQEMLSDLAERLYAQQGSTFVGILYALSSLSLTTDPVSVFKELRRWMENSNQETGALVALMFLMKDGLATALESRQVEVSDGESAADERKTCNPIVVALTSGPECVREAARFLVTIFESFSARFLFPKEFVRFLRESFQFHLRTWVEEALPLESCRKALESLFVELMHVHKGVLFEPIHQLLNSPDFIKKDPDLKKAFVAAVLWQRH